ALRDQVARHARSDLKRRHGLAGAVELGSSQAGAQVTTIDGQLLSPGPPVCADFDGRSHVFSSLALTHSSLLSKGCRPPVRASWHATGLGSCRKGLPTHSMLSPGLSVADTQACVHNLSGLSHPAA